MNQLDSHNSLGSALLGRSFVHPLFDYLLIGGALSLMATVFALSNPDYLDISEAAAVPLFVLLSNSSHFAASTVRLYTKPGANKALPFLTMLFPLVTIAVVTFCLFDPTQSGRHINSFYLTWSPYHYAAQAYGLAVMYSYRSGCILGKTDKRLLWWVCMPAFFLTFFFRPAVGMEWLMPDVWASTTAGAEAFFDATQFSLTVLAFVAPVALFVKLWRSKSGPMPVISLMAIVSNAVWWCVLSPRHAFVWATIFHGIQYLAIVTIFHVKDQVARPENRRGWVFHSISFYAMCIALGYALFQCVPLAYVFAGFGHVESMLIIAAAINLHHFIVDAYIWRLKPTDGNRKIVDSVTQTAEPAAAS